MFTKYSKKARKLEIAVDVTCDFLPFFLQTKTVKLSIVRRKKRKTREHDEKRKRSVCDRKREREGKRKGEVERGREREGLRKKGIKRERICECWRERD